MEYPPIKAGGVGVFSRELALGLVEEGVDTSVMTLRPIDDRSGVEVNLENGVKVFRIRQIPFLPESPEGQLAQQNLEVLEVMMRLIRRNRKFDIIHVQNSHLCLASTSIKRIFGIPLIWHCHILLSQWSRIAKQHFENLERTLSNEADMVICGSKESANQLQQHFGTATEKIVVIPPILGVEKFFPIEIRDAIRREKKDIERRILYVGRISEEKGLHTLLLALKSLLDRGQPVKLLVVGGATDREYLRRTLEVIGNLGIRKNVFLRGYVDLQELRKIYWSSDIVAIPSLTESFGRVAVEAMAAGIPVVASDVGGLKELIVDGVTGVKVRPEDPQALADAISGILGDEKRAMELVRRASELAKERYSSKNVMSDLLGVYNLLTSRG